MSFPSRYVGANGSLDDSELPPDPFYFSGYHLITYKAVDLVQRDHPRAAPDQRQQPPRGPIIAVCYHQDAQIGGGK